MKQKISNQRLILLLLCTAFFFLSCGKKEESPENKTPGDIGSSMSQELEGDGETGDLFGIKRKNI